MAQSVPEAISGQLGCLLYSCCLLLAPLIHAAVQLFCMHHLKSLQRAECGCCTQFVLELLRERPVYAADKVTGKEHFVSPPELANRIMVARKALAGGMSKFDFPTYIQRTNTEVLRQHLESNSYTSGSYEKVERRRQRRA